MEREMQINELYNIIHENTPLPQRRSRDLAIRLYDENYRKEKQGKWIQRKSWKYPVCSNCSHELKDEANNYCPNCGARMVGEKE